MPQPSEQSMNTAKSLGDFVKKPDLGTTGGNGGSPVDLLGQIYDMMLKVQEEQDIDHELSMKEQKEKDKKEKDRNAALIKVLTARRKLKAKKPSKKKEEPKKEEPKKPEGKDKADKEAKDKADKEAKTAKDKADKEAKDKADKEAKDKADKEAKQTAEKQKADQEQKKKTATEDKRTEPPPKTEPIPKPADVKPTPSAAKTGKITKKIEATGAIAVTAAMFGKEALAMPSDSVAAAIDNASNKVGVSKPLMYAIAKQESGFNADAAATTSSAKGLYQFIKGTWAQMVKTYGNKYPILKERGPEDAEANAIAGALYIKENSDILKKANIPVNATSIYTAHFLGGGGARTLFSMNPDDIAADVLPAPAAANKFIFYRNDPKTKKPDVDNPRTAKEVIQVLFQKVGQYEERYAQALNIPVPSENETGKRISLASSENSDLNENLKKQQQVSSTNIVDASTTQQQSAPINQAKVDDRSPMQKKMQG